MSENVEVQLEDQEFKLESDNELRFEVENKTETVVLKLKSGLAEIFGAELVKGKCYTFYFGAKIAVFTWKGCTLKLRGKKGIKYILSKETPMISYLNYHKSLEKLRVKSEKENSRGPVTMIVGPTDVGKSTLCRILLNYSSRMNSGDRKPIYVDLDPSQGQISIPSTIGALMVDRPAEVEGTFSHVDTLVYHYGHVKMTNTTLYEALISRIAEDIRQRMNTNPRIKHSGLIINTISWVKGEWYHNYLNYIVRVFEVTRILVIDQERLHNELKRGMPDFIEFDLLPKSGVVVKRSQQFKSESREAHIREYFYGTPTNVLYPRTREVKFSDIKVYRIGSPPIQGFKALNMNKIYLHKMLEPVTPGPSMMHHILSVSFGTSMKDVVRNTVNGFVCVTNVDTSRKMLTLLSPQPQPKHLTIYLMSDVQFLDTR